jgi:tRNA nucleotidyltransferase (CCA-adding enzyme)
MEYHTHCHRVFELRADTLTRMLQTLGALKSENHLEDFLLACEADARGRTGFEQIAYPQADYIRMAAKVALSVDTREVMKTNIQGAQIGVAIQQLRSQAVNAFKQQYQIPTPHQV